MSDVKAIADRFEIEALRGEFTDAVMSTTTAGGGTATNPAFGPLGLVVVEPLLRLVGTLVVRL